VRLELEGLEERTLLAGNPIIGTGTGLTAQYFSNRDLTTLAATRVDALVNLSLNPAQSPVAGLASSNYSVRWSGQVQAQFTETYTFQTLSDDGIRLWVNGQPLINNWTDHAPRLDQGTISLVAGQKYAIQVEFYQARGDAVAKLSWSSPSTVNQLVPTSQLYSGASNTPPRGQLSAGNVTTAGGNGHTFSVTYTDDTAVDTSSLGTGDVQIVGPNGFNLVAGLISVDSGQNGPTRTATYRVMAAGGSWDAGDNGTYNVLLRGNQVRDTAGAFTAATSLGSFQVAIGGGAADWYSQHLTDSAMVGMVRSLGADQQLSRGDLLTIFGQVKQDGTVSANELADLRTLVANAGLLGMADPVRSLADKVVNGNPANQRYQGQALGNLTAGSSGTILQNLVNKWFLGLDRPAVDAGIAYVAAAGSLFGAGPSYTDVRQGQVSDCYFLAGLSEVVFRDPAAIRNMFIDNGDGTFTVRFYNGGVADYVTVDRWLPATAGGAFRYASGGGQVNDASNRLWVALAEKAYAQLVESGWSRPGQTANAYSSIAVGWEGNAVRQISNRTATLGTISADAATLNAIVAAFQAGQMVGLDTKPATDPGIVANHVYVMIGYSAAQQQFTLYNPWGYTQQLTWSQVAGNFNYWSRTS